MIYSVLSGTLNPTRLLYHVTLEVDGTRQTNIQGRLGNCDVSAVIFGIGPCP